MTFADDLKAKIRNSDIEATLSQLIDDAEKFVGSATEKAGDAAHDKRDEVAEWLDKATARINDKTQNKYADKVASLSDAILGGVDKLAEKRSAGDASGPATPAEPVELPPTDERPTPGV